MKIDINDLTLGQIKELTASIQNKKEHPFEIGKSYFIRTVTMSHVGVLVNIYDNEIVLSKCSWIADTGRFHNALKNGNFDEIEPFINEVIIGRHAIIDMTLWDHDLPTDQK